MLFLSLYYFPLIEDPFLKNEAGYWLSVSAVFLFPQGSSAQAFCYPAYLSSFLFKNCGVFSIFLLFSFYLFWGVLFPSKQIKTHPSSDSSLQNFFSSILICFYIQVFLLLKLSLASLFSQVFYNPITRAGFWQNWSRDCAIFSSNTIFHDFSILQGQSPCSYPLFLWVSSFFTQGLESRFIRCIFPQFFHTTVSSSWLRSVFSGFTLIIFVFSPEKFDMIPFSITTFSSSLHSLTVIRLWYW